MSTDTPNKPSRMIVSLQLGGFFFALANVICVAILAWTYLAVKLEPKTIEVKGSAKKAIESDLITWSATITAKDADLTKAYDKLKSDADKVAAFLKDKNIPDKEITFSQISTCKTFVKQEVPQPPVNGNPQPSQWIDTDQVKTYTLSQSITIESQDMKRVPEVSRSITSLIKDGVEIDSGTPSYLYTKLSELKIDMLAEATKDATTRASQIVNNANGRLGRLVEAKMGVMQINPKGSSNTSAEGNNDTTSFAKEITAIVSATYELK
ncbi:MAG TPA: SIMPL domain-containing protein [Phycisphaerae bacterium]|nr:SIMPL domain-containing protein [Phycisphaerae bacterium]